MSIILMKIDDENRAECESLKVTGEQRLYIADNAGSLKEAADNPDVARPFAIYDGNKMIGFTMFAFDEENEDPEDKHWLWRFMIDEKYQGRGYGRAALKEIIKYFKDEHADIITLSTKESNLRALHLYHQAGFVENGQMNDGEIVLKLELTGEKL